MYQKNSNERYIVNQEELTLLNKYGGIMSQKKDRYRYDTFDRDTLIAFCMMKDKSNELYFRRYQAARDVIDLIAKTVDIDPNNTSFWLYSPETDGSSPIVNKIKNYISSRGEKAKLKKRVDELESENSLLRSLIQK